MILIIRQYLATKNFIYTNFANSLKANEEKFHYLISFRDKFFFQK